MDNKTFSILDKLIKIFSQKGNITPDEIQELKDYLIETNIVDSDEDADSWIRNYLNKKYPEVKILKLEETLNPQNMTNEQLRLQFLSGIITESEYKAKLMEFDMDQFSMGNSSSPKASFEDKWNDVPNANKEVLKKSTGKEPVKIMASSKGENYVITKGSDNKFYRYQYTQAENPGKPVGPFNSEEEAKKLNESLNEHYIAGGIVGVGAINNPFEGRKKESYEDAFEYFLSSKYNLNEAEAEVNEDEDELEEGKEVEEPSLYEGEEPLKDISDEEKAEYLVYMTGMDYNEALMKVRQS
jgi:hypothetical protein